MRIVCNKCGRKMGIGELIPHLVNYFTKMLAPYVAPFLAEAARHYWLSPTRSFFDDSMAGLANLSKAQCPGCKKRSCWDPDPDSEIISVQKKIDKKTLTKV